MSARRAARPAPASPGPSAAIISGGPPGVCGAGVTPSSPRQAARTREARSLQLRHVQGGVGAEALELRLSVAERQPQHETPAAEEVQNDRVLRQPDGVVQRGRQPVAADGQPAGHGQQRCADRQDRRHVAVFREVVLAQPHRVQAGRLQRPRRVEQLGVQLGVRRAAAGWTLAAEVANAEAHQVDLGARSRRATGPKARAAATAPTSSTVRPVSAGASPTWSAAIPVTTAPMFPSPRPTPIIRLEARPAIAGSRRCAEAVTWASEAKSTTPATPTQPTSRPPGSQGTGSSPTSASSSEADVTVSLPSRRAATPPVRAPTEPERRKAARPSAPRLRLPPRLVISVGRKDR